MSHDNMIERLSAEDYAPDPSLVYVDLHKLHPIFDRLAYRANIILVGPKGIGKTLAVAAWAGANKVPIITADCSEDVRRSHLIGTFILRGQESPFVLGPLPTAIEIANEVGHCILCLEEINALTPQMQKVLNPLGDFRRKLEVPECKRVFSLKGGAKLWLCGTMNTSVYGGVYELNEDLKSRFRMFPLNYPNKGEEKGLLKQVLTVNGVDDKTIQNVLTLAHDTRQKSLDYSLSPRDVVQLIEDISVCGLEAALWMVTGKFEDTDRAYVKERIKSTFDVQV